MSAAVYTATDHAALSCAHLIPIKMPPTALIETGPWHAYA
jgi:hypothetical protein